MKGISLILLSTLIAACGGGGGGEIKRAPLSPDQAGIIGTCSTPTQAKELYLNYGIKYRIINLKRKLIEFYGVDQTRLKALLPNSKVLTNKFYDFSLVGQDASPEASSIEMQEESYQRREAQGNLGYSSDHFPHLQQIDVDPKGSFQGQGVKIAIVDTGVYYNHPHLNHNIALNSAEIPDDGIDNDNNGLVDDHTGWDFYNGDSRPVDDNGHGTHVAGLAAGQISGVAPAAKIIPIKVLNSFGQGDLGTIAQGILYAIDLGADVVNLSLGGEVSNFSSDVQKLINSVEHAHSNNALLIAASGNGGRDGLGDCNDTSAIYPANIDSDNIISVAAVDEFNQLTSYSNFGPQSVDLAAPGGASSNGGLLSTALPYCYGDCSLEEEAVYEKKIGTSMATPLVSGLAALIKSQNPSYGYKEIKERIEKSLMIEESLRNFVKGSGVINARSSLAL